MTSSAGLRGKRILVTGASSGLGREICLELAGSEGADLVISARRTGRLEALKAEIGEKYHTGVTVVPADLTVEGAVEDLYRKALDDGPLYGLVNCAGMTYYGPVSEQEGTNIQRLITLNFTAPLDLSRKFLVDAAGRGEGILLNVTSMGAFLPVPFQSVYSATKHALQAFTESAAQEYRDSGVVISTFAPAGVDTELIDLAGLDKVVSPKGLFFQTASRAAARAVRIMKRGKYRGFAGPIYRAGLFLLSMLPAKLVGRLAALVYTPR